jgi:DNA-binding transcriptional MerR regulator
MSKLYYRTAEVLELLDVPKSTLYTWEKRFDLLKEGRKVCCGCWRNYSADEVALLHTIKDLTKVKGYKIKAANDILNKTYRRQPPRRLLACNSPDKAVSILESIKLASNDDWLINRLDSVIAYLQCINDGK